MLHALGDQWIDFDLNLHELTYGPDITTLKSYLIHSHINQSILFFIYTCFYQMLHELPKFFPRANGAKRRSGRKPGARVTNLALPLAKFKVVVHGRWG